MKENENNPTATLIGMRAFVHCFHAVQSGHPHDLAAVCLSDDCAENTSQHVQHLHSVDQLTATVASLQINQQKLQAAVEVKGNNMSHIHFLDGGHRLGQWPSLSTSPRTLLQLQKCRSFCQRMSQGRSLFHLPLFGS